MKATTEIKHSSTHYPAYDVIISGAGPVGLFLACELALAKCSVLVLEKAQDPHSPLKKIPFGIRGLNSLSIEALDRRGLLSELEIHKRLKNPHMNAVEGARRQVGHFAGIPFHDADIDSAQWKYYLPGSTGNSIMSEIEELEQALTRRAESLGVAILRGQPATGFHQSADGVTVESTDQSYEGKWLVGCDGSRSAVRKAGGFEFAGTEPEFTGYSTQVDIADPEKLKPGRNATAVGMYLQSQPGFVIIQDFDAGAFHRSQQPVTKEHVQEVLRRVSGTDVSITALHIASTWTDRARQAGTYRNGRVLLAGDAAHIHAPLGGQGLNLGLGDAMNLGWKLAATIRGTAPEGLLDSYYDERYPVGEKVLDWSRAQAAIMKPDPQARALRAIMQDLMSTRDGATYIAGRLWGMYTHYDLGGGHPLTGHSVPGFEFEDGTKINELMRKGRAVLLDFTNDPSLRTFAENYDGLILYFSGKPKDNLGLSTVLVRPDGFVAWASGREAGYNRLNTSADRWLKM